MRSLQVDVIGGGPGGLFLARLLKLADPAMRVRVYERNGPDESFGFGLVFSDRTMSSLRSADLDTYQLIRRACVSWSDMELRLPGATLRYGGYGFTAIARQTLLRILQQQATSAGVELRFHQELPVGPAEAESAVGDHVIVLADGASSTNRDRYADRFGTSIDAGAARYIWFGTEAPFDAVTFPFVNTAYGPFAAHAYPYGSGRSTFIVEVDEQTWRNAGMDVSTLAARRAGHTDHYSRELLTELFSECLGGQQLIGNHSRWSSFRVVRNHCWSAGKLVLLGDAAHTAHFSVGSGTKLAMADAIVLADALRQSARLPDAFATYEATRRPPVARTQSLAQRSMRWWESFGRRLHLPPNRFGLHFVTRTGAISYAGLYRRHGDRLREAESELAQLAPAPTARTPSSDSALELPVALGPLRLANRVAVQLVGAPDRQLQLATSYAAGSSLILADWRNCHPATMLTNAPRWHEVAKQSADRGAALGLVLSSAVPLTAAHRAVIDSGAQLVEMMSDTGADLPRVTTALDELGRSIAVIAGLRCPTDRVWTSVGERILEHCAALNAHGGAGLHLHASATGTPGWEHLLMWADRIRTETGLPVLIDGPAGWALRVRTTEADDDWSTRLHAMLVSGRVDMVVAWPLGTPLP